MKKNKVFQILMHNTKKNKKDDQIWDFNTLSSSNRGSSIDQISPFSPKESEQSLS